MSNADYINFNVDGQKLSYTQKNYTSTGTIDTLFVRFKFKTDNSGNVKGGWDLPHLWAQFHDKYGNVYVKPVKDNTCSIPYDCLRHTTFRMTLFATDTEDYMVCTKRYATNEILFRFNGQANLNYDGGVSPDEPLPTNWQILLDRVDKCENTVDAETTARETADTRLEGLISDESTTRENADADLRLLINDEVNERASGDNAIQNELNERTSAFLSAEEDGVYINYINKNKENV
jgi:hypothetical protein